MNVFNQKIERIKNPQQKILQRDFHFNVFSMLILCIFLVLGVVLQVDGEPETDTVLLVYVALATLGAGGILMIAPMWVTTVQFTVLGWILMFAFFDPGYWMIFSAISVGFILAPCIQIIYQWDKGVILRLGKFRTVHGPGIFFLFPLIDRATEFVDTRVRATDFSAEKTLTRDTVPVHVDALAFWMIWDPKQAVLEVENFMEAVTLSAQTALRDSIGKHDLTELLSEREMLCNEIQEVLDAKTNPWGISILSVEFTDIIIPSALEDAMSKQAQAVREKQARVILGTAEVEIAKKFAEAAEDYRDNPTALNLRAMNMVYEGLRQKGGGMVLVPSSALESMNVGSLLGTTAFEKIFSSDKPALEGNEHQREQQDDQTEVPDGGN